MPTSTPPWPPSATASRRSSEPKGRFLVRGLRSTPTTGGDREASPQPTQQVQQNREDESPAEDVRTASNGGEAAVISLLRLFGSNEVEKYFA